MLKMGMMLRFFNRKKQLNKGRIVSNLSSLTIHIQRSLFPALEEETRAV